MTPIQDDTQEIDYCQEFQALLHAKIRLAVRCTLVAVLEEEVNLFIGAGRYERSGQQRDQCNGYTRNLGTSVGLIEDLPVPAIPNMTPALDGLTDRSDRETNKGVLKAPNWS